MTPEDFLRRLNREDPPGIPAEIGTRFHRAIETAMAKPDSAIYSFASNNCKFIFPANHTFEIGRCQIVEKDCQMTLDTSDGCIQLRGKIDGLRGTTISDIKTTKRFAATRYADSWQWRAYLAMFGKKYRKFEYQVFELHYGRAEETGVAKGELTEIEVRDFYPMAVYRYDGMEDDLKGICSELAAYLKLIDWTPPEKRQMETF